MYFADEDAEVDMEDSLGVNSNPNQVSIRIILFLNCSQQNTKCFTKCCLNVTV